MLLCSSFCLGPTNTPFIRMLPRVGKASDVHSPTVSDMGTVLYMKYICNIAPMAFKSIAVTRLQSEIIITLCLAPSLETRAHTQTYHEINGKTMEMEMVKFHSGGEGGRQAFSL